jgi:hypothetical protein
MMGSVMEFLAAIDVAPGGPSAPAWAFFTAILTLCAGIFTLLIRNRHELKMAKLSAEKAQEAAEKAQSNTANVSNGFADRMDRKLNAIALAIGELDKDFRDHLEWHLNNSTQKKEEK